MSRGLVVAAGLVAAAMLITACAATPSPTESPSPTASVTACQVSVSPESILVNGDTGQSDEVLYFAGSGFPSEVAVSVSFGGSVANASTTSAGSFTLEIGPSLQVTYPSPPTAGPGPATWTITAWDAAQPPDDGSSRPPIACETQVVVGLEFTDVSNPAPPADLSAGDYAEVIADGVRVRSEPSPSATVVGALFIGDVIRILAPAQVAEGFAWYRMETVVIQSGQALHGYVAAGTADQAFLRRTGQPLPSTPTPSPSPSPSPSASP